jgi:tetratricopeptide (TPR) repeat protein
VVLVLAVATVALLAASLWPIVPKASRARSSTELDVRQVKRLATAGRFEQAIQQVETALVSDPDNGVVRVMAAQLALDRPDPQPRRALEHLGRLRSADPVLAARAKFAEGRAVYDLLRFAEAEDCWLEALRLDPRVPEAAWALLDLYYLEGRSDEARRLALQQHEIEPDPRDRVQLLLELVRQDAEPPEPRSLADRFAPVVRAHPDDLRAVLTLGRALVRNSQIEEGLAILDDATRRWAESRDAWDALLTSLDTVGQPDRLVEAWARVPPRWHDDARLARHDGNAAQARHDWAGAARAYRRAWDARLDDVTSAYRLALLLRALGQHDQAAGCDRFNRGAQAAHTELADLYKEANAVQDLGLRPHRRLYHRLADNRERLGRRDEARAWHRLVLRDHPDDLYSRNALERLQSQGACDAPPGHGAARDGQSDDAIQERPRAPEP